jgi:hypothetical protein
MERKDFIEIMNLMANGGSTMVHYVQIEYKNGNFHNGFFSGINNNSIPPVITFCEREVPNGVNPEHLIDWYNLKTLVIKMLDEDNERIYHG